MNSALYFQAFGIVNALALVFAVGVILTDPAALLIATIKRHARNAVLQLALAGRIRWNKALPLLNWLEARK